MIVSNEREQRQQWLNGLKVGDEVIIKDSSGWGTNYRYSLHNIDKITPSRMMDVSRYRFNSDGEVRGNYGRTIIPTTPQQILDVLEVIQNKESK